jgi:hypothetical protein
MNAKNGWIAATSVKHVPRSIFLCDITEARGHRIYLSHSYPSLKEFSWEYGSAKSILSCRLGHKGVNVITFALEPSNLLQKDHWTGGRICANGTYVKEEEE